jgi:hypothetical protein
MEIKRTKKKTLISKTSVLDKEAWRDMVSDLCLMGLKDDEEAVTKALM